MSKHWKQKWMSKIGDRQLDFRNQESWDPRTPEEKARLLELRAKQMPDVDWSVDWDNFWLNDGISKDDAFEAQKTVSLETFAKYGRQDYTTFRSTETELVMPMWETYRVKACLRSGKALPRRIWERIGPRTQWPRIQQMIAEAGDLPNIGDLDCQLAQDLYDILLEVRERGYGGLIDSLAAGEVPKNGTSEAKAQERTLKYIRDNLRRLDKESNQAGKVNKVIPNINVKQDPPPAWVYDTER